MKGCSAVGPMQIQLKRQFQLARCPRFCLNFAGRKVECGGRMLKICFVGTVAERLVGGLTAAAQGYNGSSLQTVGFALSVDYLEVTFNFDGAVVVD